MAEQVLAAVNAACDAAEESEHAYAGLLYLAGSAGVWRLLVPEAAEGTIEEMKTGRAVSIETSLHARGLVDVVFEDGTASPFSVALDPRQIAPALTRGARKLAVWPQRGEVLELPCDVRV